MNQSPASALFNRFDIHETSYHVLTGRIDLHICDDVNGKVSLWDIDVGSNTVF